MSKCKCGGQIDAIVFFFENKGHYPCKRCNKLHRLIEDVFVAIQDNKGRNAYLKNGKIIWLTPRKESK